MSGEGSARYQLGALLGTGGVASVHRAVDVSSGAAVALKRLLPQFAGDTAVRRRFLREAEAAQALDHPNVVRVFDAGEDGDGPYLVMQLVEGETLRSRIDREGALPADDGRRIALALARGLAFAHARGLVHRDLKPQNVLLGRDGAVKIADFGVARVQTLASLTGSSLVWGSPQYMAPEQFTRGRVDPRSDLFSLGVVIAEMAAGRLPWPEGQALARLAGGASPAPPRLPWGDDVDALVASLLATDPGLRPASADEVAAVLEGRRPPVALVPRAICADCGAPRPADVPRCFACGREELQVRHTRGGRHRLILRKLPTDAAHTTSIQRLLEALTGQRDLRLRFLTGDRRLYSKREQRDGIALPAVLFQSLEEEDARRLEAAFRAHDIDVEVFSVEPAKRRDKVANTLAILLFAAGAGASAVMANPVLSALTMAAALAWVAKWAAKGGHLRDKKAAAGLFWLADTGAAAPFADRLLGAAHGETAHLRAPETRALFAELSAELYRLARRAERFKQVRAAGPEAALADRLLEATPRLSQRLAAAAGRLDDLDAAIDRDSEGAAAQELARLERRLSRATAEERAALEATRRDVLEALDRRQAAERDRARLSALLCAELARLREAVRGARALQAPEEREAAAVEAAQAELERFLGYEEPREPTPGSG